MVRTASKPRAISLAIAGTSHIIGNSLKVVAEAAWVAQRWEAGRRNGFAFGLQLQFLF